MDDAANTEISLLDAFRFQYFRLESVIHEAMSKPTDSIVLERISDDLNEYAALADQHIALFESTEFAQLQSNISLMSADLRIRHTEIIDESHHGHPTVITTTQTGRRGRPQIIFDHTFLAWAYNRRSISALARFLGVGRTTLRNALIDHGLLTPNTHNPNVRNDTASVPPATSTAPLSTEVDVPTDINDGSGEPLLPHNDLDDILEPILPAPTHLPRDIEEMAAGYTVPPPPSQSWHPTPPITSSSHSSISDSDLDDLIIRLRFHYRRAGISMLRGMLLRLGHRVQIQRIRMSLLRIDPVRRTFERITIRRRTYNVPGPNALWHHDGQHGLIRWGIVIHGFIDGYSRLITGLQASTNNYGQTVLDLFVRATALYGVPVKLRGDHGVENILVAAWIQERRGQRSYIWGRSVHNIRIERLWVDVTSQVGATWANLFTTLELSHGLDINNAHHIWLLHFLFIQTLNQDLLFFAEAWNEHTIQVRDGPDRSPIDMFNFDMLAHGVRGDNLADMMSDEELEVYGVDWEGLRDEGILRSQEQNNGIDEEATSWLGQAGIPPNLNEVHVEDQDIPFNEDYLQAILNTVQPWLGQSDDNSVINAWINGLACAQRISNQF